ncbi:MAG: hypothetical protein ACTSQE_03665 [Candidatus Heimdallarchaeaceae archaeon]
MPNFSMPNFRLSLVTSAGLLLATKPETADREKQVLATGLISAIISFSKEIHKRELQSIAYHDRSILTVPIKEDFVFVLEIMDEEEELSEKRRNEIIQTIRETGEKLLEGLIPTALTEGEAALLVEQCLFEVERLFITFTDQPIKQARIKHFKINMDSDPWKIENGTEDNPLFNKICRMLYRQKNKLQSSPPLRSLLMLFPEEKTVPFVILQKENDKLKIGYLQFPGALDYTIFRLFPLFERKISELNNKRDNSIVDILQFLRDLEDPGNRFSTVNSENLSLILLSRLVRVGLEKAIYSAIVGDPIYVLGDRVSIKIVLDNLSFFTQHLQTQYYEFVDETFLIREEKRFIPRIVGMSPETYEKLVKNGTIDKKDTVIDLDQGQVFGTQESIHFKDLMMKIKDKETAVVAKTILKELNHLVSMTFIITSFALLERKESLAKMKELSTQWSYPQCLVKKALKLAKEINPYLGIKS